MSRIAKIQIAPSGAGDHYIVKFGFWPQRALRMPQIRKEGEEVLEAVLQGLEEASSGGSEGFWRDGRVETLLVERSLGSAGKESSS